MLWKWLVKNGAPDGTKFKTQTDAKDWAQGYAVHHKPDGKTLQLIPEELHLANRHVGGRRLIEILRGK